MYQLRLRNVQAVRVRARSRACCILFILIALHAAPSRATPLGQPSVPFVENRGHADPRVAYTARTAHGAVFVTQAGEIVYALPGDGSVGAHGRAPLPLPGDGPVGAIHESPLPPVESTNGLTLHESLVGATVHSAKGQDPAVTKVNIFRGQDPTQWSANLPTFGRLDFGEVYPGITMHLQARQNNVEKIFVVAPGGNPDNIRLQVNVGAHGRAPLLDVDATGALVLTTDFGDVTFTEPMAYQEIAGKRRTIAVRYEVEGFEYGFAVGGYDPNVPLVIDPLLAATYLGGDENEWSGAVAVADDGSIYVSGTTFSLDDFPLTSGVYDDQFGGSNEAFVAKFDPDLRTLVASTYLGGIGSESIDNITIDSDGDVFLKGTSSSSDFPTTPDCYDPDPDGDARHFVTKLNPELSVLLASTRFGGMTDGGLVMALAEDATVYLAGGAGPTYTTTPGCYDDTQEGWGDAYIAKLDSQLSNLLAATFLGRDGSEAVKAIAFDEEGNVVVAGITNYTGFPTTPGAYDETFHFGWDGFVAKLDADLTTLLASTYLGANAKDIPQALVVDAAGNCYVAGETQSSDFPTTEEAFDQTFDGPSPGGNDPFVSKLNSDLTSLLASTYLGGQWQDYLTFVGIEPRGDVVVVGASGSLPTVPGAFQETSNGGLDLFISRLDPDLTTLRAATFLGGSGYDSSCNGVGYCAAIDQEGNVILTGRTRSEDFPIIAGAFQESLVDEDDVFVAKLDRSLQAVCRRHGDVTGDGQVTAGDAQLAFMIALGAYVAIAPQECAADCNGDGQISAGDAQQIFGKVLGTATCVDSLNDRKASR